MRASLIITTYNWKEALRCCVETAFRQTVLPNEIVIADDGSREDTAEVVQELAKRSPVPLLHAWQPDEGFRLAASRNRGIRASSGDYLLFVDGDLLLHPDFVKDHRNAAREGQWIQGSRVPIGKERTEKILATGDVRLGPFSRGIRNRQNAVRSSVLSLLAHRFRGKTGSVRGCNLSFWRKDVDIVNGFNEEFVGWGREDEEFVARLTHRGVVRRNLKFAAIAYHLYHPENSRNSLPQNDRLLTETLQERRVRCEHGLEPGPAVPVFVVPVR